MSVIIMLLLLSVLILVHEAGHFLAAKMFGMKVEKFGFGLPIGPVLYQTKIGDTTVLIHAFLLGGYISFPDDEKDCELSSDSGDRFLNRPIYQRVIVISAGVVANVICAFVLVLLTAFLWGHIPAGKYNIFVNDITAAKQQSVWQSGMEKGDRIAAVNNTVVTNTYSLLKIIQLSKKQDGLVSDNTVNQNFSKLNKLNPMFAKDEIIPSGVLVKIPYQIVQEDPVSMNTITEKGVKQYENKEVKLSPELIALREALRDKSYYISEEKFTLLDIAKALSDNVHPLNIQVERNGKIIDLKPMFPDEKGTIGIKLEAKEILVPTTSITSAVKASTKYLYDNTYYMLLGLYQIFTGKVPLKDLHGIVAITKVGGDIIDNSGIFYGLLLTAIISMDLAIINFLPIPALDGGHILFLFLEKIRGKRLNDNVVERISTFFFLLLILLMVFVVFNDIIGLINNKF